MQELPASWAQITDFVRQSNAIEGITKNTTMEVREFCELLQKDRITIDDLKDFARRNARAEIRDKPNMNVRIGHHIPMRGGPKVVARLGGLIEAANLHRGDRHVAFDVHIEFEQLHPFMDGNGRTGRMLWAWMVGVENLPPLGFLQHFYYDSLAYWQD